MLSTDHDAAVAITNSDPSPSQPGGKVDQKSDHTVFEDVYGILTASSLIALGLCLLKSGGMVTGGAAGMGLLASYLVSWPPAVLLTVINLPFFAFSWHTMGSRFTIKSLAGNIAVILIAQGLSVSVDFTIMNPAVTAILSGTIIGMGVLALARHQTGVGAVGIIAIWHNRSRGVNIGLSQVVMDILILGLGFPLISNAAWGWSVASVLAVGLVPYIWHRPGRYMVN